MWTLKKCTYRVVKDMAVGDYEPMSDVIKRGLLKGWIVVEWPEEREEVEKSNGSGSEAS